MACDGNDYVTNFRDGVLTLFDGAGHSLVVPLEMGDVAISGMNGDMTEHAQYFSRGRKVAVRKTQDLTPTIAFSAMLNRLSSAAALKPAVLDFLRFTGYYATNVRTDGICGDAKTVDCKLALTVPEGTDYIYLRDVIFAFDIGEGDPSSISMSGTVENPDITIVGAAV